MVVEDEPPVRRGLRHLLERAGHSVIEADSVKSALLQLTSGAGIDVMVLDLGLPDQSGLALVKHARRLVPAVAVVVVTASEDRHDMRRALASGAFSYLRKSADDLMIEAQVQIAVERVRSERDSDRGRQRLEGALVEVSSLLEGVPAKLAEGLCGAWDMRHVETGAHVQRIGVFSRVIAHALGFSAKDAEGLGQAAMLHDVGKLCIPDAILTKPGRLTPEEFQVMQRHTTEGYRMLAPIDHPFFRKAAMIALRHHERWDGSGYPGRLRADECPRDARIVGLVDVYDALGQPRCYKPAWSEEQILSFFREQSGTQFEPLLVEALLDNLEPLKRAALDLVESPSSTRTPDLAALG